MSSATEAIGSSPLQALLQSPPPSSSAVNSHSVRQMAPLSGVLLEVSNKSEEKAASNGGGRDHNTAVASTEAIEAEDNILDAGAYPSSKLHEQQKKQVEDHAAEDEEPEKKAKAAASEKALTGTDSWLAVAENEAVGGDALKDLEAVAAASMIPSGTTTTATTNSTTTNQQHQRLEDPFSSSYHPTTSKSVEEASTPKLHHHHHHHHHYHHHQHTLRSHNSNSVIVQNY